MLPPFQVSVTENGLTAETGKTINILQWNWHKIHPTSHHDALPQYRRKENNVLPSASSILIIKYHLELTTEFYKLILNFDQRIILILKSFFIFDLFMP